MKPCRAEKEEPKLDISVIRTLQTSLTEYQTALSLCFVGMCSCLAWKKATDLEEGSLVLCRRCSCGTKPIVSVSRAQRSPWARPWACLVGRGPGGWWRLQMVGTWLFFFFAGAHRHVVSLWSVVKHPGYIVEVWSVSTHCLCVREVGARAFQSPESSWKLDSSQESIIQERSQFSFTSVIVQLPKCTACHSKCPRNVNCCCCHSCSIGVVWLSYFVLMCAS